MQLEAALLAAILAKQPSMGHAQATVYAKTIATESAQKHLDPWVFWAIIKKESWFISSAMNKHDGDCYVGLGQIRVAGCVEERVHALLDPVTNLRTSAFVQQQAMRWCRLHVCPNGWLYLYNPSKTYGTEVRALAKETKRAHFHIRDLRQVRSRMHVRKRPGM